VEGKFCPINKLAVFTHWLVLAAALIADAVIVARKSNVEK